MTTTVAGLPLHVSTEARPGDRGYRFGTVQAAAVTNTVEFYTRLLSELCAATTPELVVAGTSIADRLVAGHPELVEEIDGIAAGARVDPAVLMAANARTELLAGTAYSGGDGTPRALLPECTTIGVLPEASAEELCVLAQNWDFHPDISPSRVIWTVRGDGRWHTTFTEAGILAKTGLNSDRVGITLNFMATAGDRGVVGVPVHLIMRQVLENSRNVQDAVRIIQLAGSEVSGCLTVAHAHGSTGTVVSAEVSPTGVTLAWPGRPGVLTHTNHFKEGRGDDLFRTRPGFIGTLVRAWCAEHELPDSNIKLTDIESVLSSPSVAQSCTELPWQERCETLMSILLDLTNRDVWIRPGLNFEGYTKVPGPTKLGKID